MLKILFGSTVEEECTEREGWKLIAKAKKGGSPPFIEQSHSFAAYFKKVSRCAKYFSANSVIAVWS